MRKPKKPADPAIKRCIDAFYDAYVRFHNPEFAERWLADRDRGVPPSERSVPQSRMILPRIHGAKDGDLMKKMLAAWGEERVLALIRDFFGRYYTRVSDSNQDIGALYMVAPRLLVQDRAVTSRRTADNLDAAARATRKLTPSGVPLLEGKVRP